MKHSILISIQENMKPTTAFQQDATDERYHTSKRTTGKKKTSLTISFTLQVCIPGANKKSGTHRFNLHPKALP